MDLNTLALIVEKLKMNHNLYQPNHNSENDSRPNNGYIKWQEAMKGVEFQGDKTSGSTIDYEAVATPTSSEVQEKPISKMEKLLGKIQGFKDYIKNKFGVQNSEKLVEMTDYALVHIAKKTITAADEDGFRTEAEVAEIEEAVSSVVVQGAMEEAGMEQSAGENPILELYQSDAQPDLMTSIEILHEEGVCILNGESVAGLATRTIERGKNGMKMSAEERREYLAKTYGEPELGKPSNPESRERRSRRRVSETIRMLSGLEMERSGETAVRPRIEIVCDHGHIEGQKIDVINKRDRGMMEFSFKLRAPTEAMAALATKSEGEGENAQAEITTPSGAVLRRGKITYESASSDSSYELCDASVFEKGGVKVFIADPSSRNGEDELISIVYNNSHLVRTAMGLVKVEVPSGTDPEATEQVLGEILEKDLGIPDALGEVPEEAEREYKMARYKWQHVIAGDLTPEQMEQAEKLHREEVFPGYTTLVDRDKHVEYLGRYGEDIRAIHHLWTGSAKSIYRILTQGLMCTTERYSRGVMKNGMSSTTDMDTGGADSVFTRIANEAQRGEMNGAVVVFKPEVFDRTDWYSYNSDTYGSTDDDYFVERLSPDTIFDKTTNPSSYYSSSNEQMFRTGIGARFIESIEVGSDSRDGIIAELRSMGLEEINGKPIEEVVILRKTPPSEATPDSTGNWDVFNQSPEEYAEKQKLEQAEKQAKMQALISGEEPYTSIDEIIDLASAGDDFNISFKSMIESVVAHGGKIQLSNDIAEYIKKEMNLNELKALALGEALDGYPDKELFLYLRSALGIDYGVLYEEALASQLKTTPETPSSEPWADWPDDWGNWDESFSTPTPEPPSESVDGWM